MATTKKTKGYTKHQCEPTTIKFRTANNLNTWIIMNNLYSFGLDIQAAFINWSARVQPENINPKDFCDYVISKDPTNLRCYTFGTDKW